MKPLTTFLLIISVSLYVHAGKECSKESLVECLTKFQEYFEDDYHFVKKTEASIDELCHELHQDSECLSDASDVCAKPYPLISALTVTLYNQVNQLCSPGTHHRETYMKMLPCIDKHEKDFEECSGEHHEKKFHDEKLQSVCVDMHSMICVAEKSRKYCGEVGKSLAERLEVGVKDKYHEVCSSGCKGIFNNCWILIISLVVALLLNNKKRF